MAKCARHRETARPPGPISSPPAWPCPNLLVSPDQNIPAVTSAEYLAEVDRIMLGQAPDQTLTLNPSVNKWLNGEPGLD
jgi:hypothetical protein